jgi:hypothetical protein
MQLRFWSLKVLTLAAIVATSACAPKATPPPVDSVSTVAAALVNMMMTQTAAAASPTPTVTLTPNPTETMTVTPTSSDPARRPQTVNFAGCYFGPGPSFTLESNIAKGKAVDLLGIGNVPGWYIIRNPYFHRPCWIQEVDLKIFDGTDLSQYPVMTPGIPAMGQ